MKRKQVTINKCVLAMFDRDLPKYFFNQIDLDSNGVLYAEKLVLKAHSEMKYKEGIIGQNIEINIKDENLIDELYKNFIGRLDNENSCIILCEYTYNEKEFIGCFRIEYQLGGYTFLAEDGSMNLCFNQKNLPSSIRKAKEFFLYCPKDGVIRSFGNTDYQSFIRNEFKINSVKTEFEKIDIVDKLVKETVMNSYGEQLGEKKLLEYKSVLAQEIEETGEFNPENLLDTFFSDSQKAQETYANQLKEIESGSIKVSAQMEKKIRRKQKIKTSSGIEIIVPVDMINDINSIEYIQDHTGKISIVLKDVGKIV